MQFCQFPKYTPPTPFGYVWLGGVSHTLESGGLESLESDIPAKYRVSHAVGRYSPLHSPNIIVNL